MFATTLFSMSEGNKRVKPDAELSQDRKRLKRRRLMARLGLRETAAKAGIAPSYLSELESGYKSAGPGVLGSLADALGCDITEIMPRERNGAAA
jgi:transcriptional regulator with XRE-family HTH domain